MSPHHFAWHSHTQEVMTQCHSHMHIHSLRGIQVHTRKDKKSQGRSPFSTEMCHILMLIHPHDIHIVSPTLTLILPLSTLGTSASHLCTLTFIFRSERNLAHISTLVFIFWSNYKSWGEMCFQFTTLGYSMQASKGYKKGFQSPNSREIQLGKK